MKNTPYSSTAGSRNHTWGLGRRIARATRCPTVGPDTVTFAAKRDRLQARVRLDAGLHLLGELLGGEVAGEDAGAGDHRVERAARLRQVEPDRDIRAAREHHL